MTRMGIRALKQNASAVVAEAAKGVTVTITDRGRAVALLSPIPRSRLEELVATGRARPPRRAGGLSELSAPTRPAASDLGATLREMRDDERY